MDEHELLFFDESRVAFGLFGENQQLQSVGFIVQRDEHALAAFGVLPAHRGDDAGDGHEVVARVQIGEFGRRDLPRFLLVFVKQMTGEVEAERDFFVCELLAQRPRLNVFQLGLPLLAKGLLVVKQAVLVRVVGGVCGRLQCCVNAGQQAGAVGVELVKRTGLDQRFDGAAVDVGFVHTHTEIEETGECAIGRTLVGDGFDRRLPRAFDRAQTVANGFGVAFAFA